MRTFAYYCCVIFVALTVLGIPELLRDRWRKTHGWRNVAHDIGVKSGAAYTLTDMDTNVETFYHVEKVSFDGNWVKVSKIEKVQHE